MSRSAPFPWIVLLAYGVLFFAPAINEWIDRHPHIKHGRDRLRGEITRRSTSKDLERWGHR